LIAAHDRATDLFEVGEAASYNLQAMAEGGDISGLIGDIEAADGVYVENPAAGLLAPGQTTEASLEIRDHHNNRLSVVAMLLPTNDGFVGLDGLQIPRHRGTYAYTLMAYDAGTEANDEIINGGATPGVLGIPADPGGNAGSGGISTIGPDYNQTVHIHRGTLGDLDPFGGISDLDSGIHHFQNPVARIVLKVGKMPHHDRD
jgi:hypothetical protein